MANISEYELLKLFEKAYSDHLHKVIYYAFSFLKDMDEARSVAQDVFTKLWEKRHDIDPDSEVLTFLSVLTKNACLNILRRRKISKKYTDFTAYNSLQFNIDVLEKEGAVKVFSKEVCELYDKALKEMSEKTRSTFLLSRGKGLKNREIANFQNVGISTVEYRMSNAFKILRKYFKDYIGFVVLFI